MKFVYAVLLCATHQFAISQQLPATEIYLCDLNITDNSVILSNPVNISNHSGYDNQPFFHPAKSILFYSSTNAEDRTDIKSYNFDTGETKSITETNEREYSPTVTPDGQFISCIIQRDNGEQNLGKYPIEGGDPLVLINDLTIGYHAWISADKLIAFVLGEPHTLHLVDLKEKVDKTIVSSISRSLHKIPNAEAMSFLQKMESNLWEIRQLNPTSLAMNTITQTMDGLEHDIAWTPDGKILASTGDRIHYFDCKNDRNGWRSVELPSGFKKVITRMAVNATGNRIALVVGE